VQIGLVPNTEWLQGTLALSRQGEIEIDARCATSVPGVFAAGELDGEAIGAVDAPHLPDAGDVPGEEQALAIGREHAGPRGPHIEERLNAPGDRRRQRRSAEAGEDLGRHALGAVAAVARRRRRPTLTNRDAQPSVDGHRRSGRGRGLGNAEGRRHLGNSRVDDGGDGEQEGHGRGAHAVFIASIGAGRIGTDVQRTPLASPTGAL
jgi:hypothetical protein